MALLPIIQQTKVNLVKGQLRARKNLQKIIEAGEGRAKRNLEKVLNRRWGTSKKNPEKTGKFRFFLKKKIYKILRKTCWQYPSFHQTIIHNAFVNDILKRMSNTISVHRQGTSREKKLHVIYELPDTINHLIVWDSWKADKCFLLYLPLWYCL